MPELAEVEYFRKQWDPGLRKKVKEIYVNFKSRVLRETSPKELCDMLKDSTLRDSRAKGKQMLFRFTGGRIPRGESGWLGVHLGMTGKLSFQDKAYALRKHDHLVLEISSGFLVYTDSRLFGLIRFEVGTEEPDYWKALPPEVLSEAFTKDALADYLKRKSKSPLKSILLMQDRFPGVGNWMADEMLWRAGIHPATPGGKVSGKHLTALYNAIRKVCQGALDTVGEDYRDPPKSWLFPHRWKDGGRCPRTKAPLVREKIGGRTTCYSPERQVKL